MDIYSGQKEKVLKVLNAYTFKSVYISVNKKIKVDNQTFDLSNKEIVKDILLTNDILFLRFESNITYNDYIESLKQIKSIIKAVQEETKKRAWVIEVSFELEKFLIEKNINF